MTRDEILAMKPGRELDALVAERVLGYKVVDVLPQGITYMAGKRKRWIKNPNYSTGVAAAWEAVEEMNDCLHLREHGEEGRWEANFCGYPGSRAHGATAPEAICKAALLAVMEEGDNHGS